MIRLVWECSCRIYEIVFPVNSEALINDVSGLLSEFTMLKKHMDMVQSMVQIYSETPPSSI